MYITILGLKGNWIVLSAVLSTFGAPNGRPIPSAYFSISYAAKRKKVEFTLIVRSTLVGWTDLMARLGAVGTVRPDKKNRNGIISVVLFAYCGVG